jgi:K+-transporting ATPase ATPase C chain
MLQHLRANLWLLILTVLLCCVLYPLMLLGVGRTAFRSQAEGSLVRNDDGTVVGSRLIGQAFSKDEYFQPRPSNAGNNGYDASASGASNWSASNPLLRDRVARALGPIVKYRGGLNQGLPVGADIEKWFLQQPPDYVALWAKEHPELAKQWIKDNSAVAAAWLGKKEEEVKDDPGATAKAFFPLYAQKHPRTWPTSEEVKDKDGASTKRLAPAEKGSDIQAYLFDPWLQAHPGAELETVPADLVMASGSGLDPHITLQNANYQLERVAGAWVEKTKTDPKAVRGEIEKILKEKQESPLNGLVGVPLVNVLEVNRELDKRVPRLAPGGGTR